MTTTAATKKKLETQKSEFWTAILTVVGTLVATLTGSKTVLGSTASTVVAIIGLIVITGVYAYFKTDLPTDKPGWKTREFWAAVIAIVGSVATALSEASIAGMSPTVTKIAALVGAAVVTSGYTIYRWSEKTAATRAAAKAAKVAAPPAPPTA